MKLTICHLNALHIHRSSERNGDELFLKLDGRKIWPENKQYSSGTDNGVIPINLKITVNDVEKLTLQLFDRDLFSSDLLGEFIFPVDSEGDFRSDLQCKDANEHRFSLEYSVYPVSRGL